VALSKFDLTLHVTEKNGNIGLTLIYNADLFCVNRMRRLLEHLQTLLVNAIADPDQHLSNFSLLRDAERHQLLFECNGANTAYPNSQCIHQLFEAQVERTPDAVAVVYNEHRLTYRELNGRANQLAHYLRRQGVTAETRVGISVERSLDMLVGILGILKAGAAYVPLDPEYPRDRLSFMLEETQAPVLLTQQPLLGALPETPHFDQSNPAIQNPKSKTCAEPGRSIQNRMVVCLDSDWHTIAQERDDNPLTVTVPEDLAYVIYTSGSTGRPKGVLTCHRGVVNYFSYLIQTYNLDSADTILQLPSLSFDASVRDLLGPLTAGAKVVIVNSHDAKDPGALLDRITGAGVTCLLSVVPTLLTGL
jgi:non-ribosomal peptide synthetase component F